MARASGGIDAARAASAQSSGIVDRDPYFVQAALCFHASAHWCLGVTVLSNNNRPMKECPMQRQGRCDRPHDAESCRSLWTQNSERGIRFRKQLGDYVKVVEKNMGKEPSREQLLCGDSSSCSNPTLARPSSRSSPRLKSEAKPQVKPKAKGFFQDAELEVQS